MVESTNKANNPYVKETGDRWDESLPFFGEGSININFLDNQIRFTAGDACQGTIDVELKSDLPSVKELQVSLVGVERCFLDASQAARPEPFHKEQREIINLRAVVREYTEGIVAG